MGTIDTAVYSRLSTHAGLIALVSSRIYPPPVPQSPTYPLVTFFEVDDVGDHAMGCATDLIDARYQFDCWAETRAAARAVARQVKATLDNWSGTSDSVEIKISLYLGGRDMPFEPGDNLGIPVGPSGGVKEAFRRIVEFSIQYMEPAA